MTSAVSRHSGIYRRAASTPGPGDPFAGRYHARETGPQADAIYIDEIRKADLYDAIWQAFAVFYRFARLA